MCVSPWDPGGCGCGAFSCGHWWADVSVPPSAPSPGHVPRCPPAYSPLTPADRLSSGVRPLPPGLGVSPTDLGETPSSVFRPVGGGSTCCPVRAVARLLLLLGYLLSSVPVASAREPAPTFPHGMSPPHIHSCLICRPLQLGPTVFPQVCVWVAAAAGSGCDRLNRQPKN